MGRAKVEKIHGVPTIVIDGKPLPPMAFTIQRYGGADKSAYINEAYYDAMGKAGLKLYFVCADTEWTQPGSKERCFNEMEAILRVNPDAYFIMRLGLHPPMEWAKANPDELMQYSDGISHAFSMATETGRTEYPSMYSLCSEKWRSDAGEALRDMYRAVMERPYSDRVVGVFFAAGGSSEWYYVTPMNYSEKTQYVDTGGFDHVKNKDYAPAYGDLSPAFRRAFSKYLKAKYGTEEALRNAWKDSEASFENPRIPDLEKRYYVDDVDYDVDHLPFVGCTAKPPFPTNGTNIGHFVDLAKNMDVFDFYRALHLGTADSVIYFGNVIKEISGGDMLTGAFYGAAGSTHFFAFSQVGGVHRILESGVVDFLASPGVYENRHPGGFTGVRQVTDSINLHGSIMFAEDDERTHMEGPYYQSFFEVYSTEDTGNVMKRTLGRNLAQNTYGWWFDQHAGGGRYGDAYTLSLLEKQQKIVKDYYENDARTKNSEIAFIYDEESYHVISHECSHHAVELFRNYEIDRIGAPSDRYFHNDLASPEVPDYKLYVFVNTLYLTDAEREVIKKKLRKNHATALFLYGAGVINPDREEIFSPENMEDLTGIKTAMRNDGVRGKFKFTEDCGAYADGLDKYEIHGDFKRKMCTNHSSYMNREKNSKVMLYPVLYAADDEAKTLARLLENGDPALSVKECDGYTSIYSATRYLSSEVLRSIARIAGVHLYLENDDVVYACDRFLTVHSSRTEKKHIKLPRAASAYEVYEEKYYCHGEKEFFCDMKYGETKTFRISYEE